MYIVYRSDSYSLLHAPAPARILTEYLRAGREVYEREERARKDLLDRTLTSQSRMLADLARRVLDTGDAVSAILLCLEALPDDAQKVDRPLVEAAAEVCYQALSRQQ